MQAVETVEKGSFVAKLYPDDDVQSPRDSMDLLGTLVIWHRRHTIDEDGQRRFGTPEKFREEAARGSWIYLPVAMLDHSGVTLYEGAGAHALDPGGRDSGQVGYIYATPGSVKGTGTPPKRIKAVLRQELETWAQWVSGDVYGYQIEQDGEVVDSCWGFYGRDAMRSMLEALETAIEEEERVKKMVETGFAL